jgi:hypothetical protein
MEKARRRRHISCMSDKRPKHPSSKKALARWENEGGALKPGDRSTRKRPRDASQLTKMIADIATGEVEKREPRPRSKAKT